MSWTEHDIPDQTGRTAVITGANSGLGLRAAHVLAEHGARVILACRSPERGAAAAETVGGELVVLDLADLAAVRTAAATIRERTGDRVDLLVNNAGVPMGRHRRTVDGHESIFATNHLGHAALTWLLMPALRGGTRPRVVTVSSLSSRGAGLDLADPNFDHRRFGMQRAYAQSKRANLIFARELDRRLRAAGDPVRSLAAHPGYAGTDIAAAGARNQGMGALAGFFNRLNKALAQSVRAGTLPLLYAATAPDATGYYGPSRFGELYRGVGTAKVPAAAADPTTATRLWDVTATLTDIQPDPA